MRRASIFAAALAAAGLAAYEAAPGAGAEGAQETLERAAAGGEALLHEDERDVERRGRARPSPGGR